MTNTEEALTSLLLCKADTIRKEYQLAYGKPCDCSTPDSALHYGRAQGLEIAADIVGADQAPQAHVAGDPAGLKPIPIEAAKRIAKEYGYDQVLIYARRCHNTPEPHGEHMTTYGRNREHCDVAARIGDTLKKFMGWEV